MSLDGSKFNYTTGVSLSLCTLLGMKVYEDHDGERRGHEKEI